MDAPLLVDARIGGLEVSGAALGEVGLAIAARRPLEPVLILVEGR